MFQGVFEKSLLNQFCVLGIPSLPNFILCCHNLQDIYLSSAILGTLCAIYITISTFASVCPKVSMSFNITQTNFISIISNSFLQVPEEKQMQLFTYLRLASSFSNYSKRLKCVQARLQALSVLIYSNTLTENVQSLLYSGLLEELVEVLEMDGEHLMEIKASALKALTSIIHLDRNPNYPKLNTIIDVTGASSYHGFLPVMVRNCIGKGITFNSKSHPE